MIKTTRDLNEIIDLLVHNRDLDYHEKIALAIEAYISKLKPFKQQKAWQELPYLVQFWPILLKRWNLLPDIRWVNQWIEYWWFTEYDKDNILNKIPSIYSLISADLWDEEFDYENISAILNKHKVSYPLMIKAKKWERGAWIYFIKDEKALLAHWNNIRQGLTNREPSEAQEYSFLKEEYCLQFYQTRDKNGKKIIESWWLTLRDIPFVIWNWSDTVEQLIWELLLPQNIKEKIIVSLELSDEEILKNIPAMWKQIQIVRTASIDYWTVYKTISLTKNQEKRIIEVLSKLLQNIGPEFLSVWRFDLKAESLQDLLAWKVKVIECNAAWGIPTIVYDESLSIKEKYEILHKHFNKMKIISSINKNKYTWITKWLIAWPEFLYISYQSLSKKWVKPFSKKTVQIRKIYQEIFETLRIWRRKRRKNLLKNIVEYIWC